jgi:hypothetical protein
MSNQLTISYSDGTTATCSPTLFDTMKAERYGAANGLGNMTVAPIENMAYSAYAALRRTGQLTAGQTFDAWAQTVAAITAGDQLTEPVSEPDPTIAPLGNSLSVLPSGLTESVENADPLAGGPLAASPNAV